MSAHVEVEGLDDLLRMFRNTPKELQKEMRSESKAIAEPIAADARSRALNGSPQLAAIASTIRSKSDRVPTIVAGGPKRVTSNRSAAASQVYFGADFGSNRYRQFPSVVKGGRTIYPAINSNEADTGERWLGAVERVFDGTHT